MRAMHGRFLNGYRAGSASVHERKPDGRVAKERESVCMDYYTEWIDRLHASQYVF